MPLGQRDIAKINEKLSEYHTFVSHNGLLLYSLQISVEIYTVKNQKTLLHIIYNYIYTVNL